MRQRNALFVVQNIRQTRTANNAPNGNRIPCPIGQDFLEECSARCSIEWRCGKFARQAFTDTRSLAGSWPYLWVCFLAILLSTTVDAKVFRPNVTVQFRLEAADYAHERWMRALMAAGRRGAVDVVVRLSREDWNCRGCGIIKCAIIES